MKMHRGFTLIELMVTVAVVAIMASVAYPSYQAYLIRNNRAAAQSALMDVAQRQQQFLLDNRGYTCDLTSTGLNWTVPASVAQNYTIAVTMTPGTCALPPTPPAFTATATPKAGTRQVVDGNLTIDQAGSKLPANKW
jgi:type IV pilus assembly protein PilE